MDTMVIELLERGYSVTEIVLRTGYEYSYVDAILCEYLAKELSEVSGDL